jgi:hypothetical protein
VPLVDDGDIGPLYNGLWGYIVTGIERTITAESQLVRLYGHPIPEPATWLLACLALCWFRRQTKR